ncbi:hypothetical protein [Methylobacterium sp. E-046]|uniref:hypothetical protein n=1 Tax=Methylobacterium sp. E-046 TaxID=2836576 RepID=UPI001FBAA76D|nr:hypothetical protein [Methylobacterium sp. E-046]MCJ2101020.1 hypothetical protein [Methylobacterium sp. E-046]
MKRAFSDRLPCQKCAAEIQILHYENAAAETWSLISGAKFMLENTEELDAFNITITDKMQITINPERGLLHKTRAMKNFNGVDPVSYIARALPRHIKQNKA